jgi:hypothetical protein
VSTFFLSFFKTHAFLINGYKVKLMLFKKKKKTCRSSSLTHFFSKKKDGRHNRAQLCVT